MEDTASEGGGGGGGGNGRSAGHPAGHKAQLLRDPCGGQLDTCCTMNPLSAHPSKVLSPLVHSHYRNPTAHTLVIVNILGCQI